MELRDMAIRLEEIKSIKKALEAEERELRTDIENRWELGEIDNSNDLDGIELNVREGNKVVDKDWVRIHLPQSERPELYKFEVDNAVAKTVLGNTPDAWKRQKPVVTTNVL